MKVSTSHMLALAASLVLGANVLAQDNTAPGTNTGERPNAADRSADEKRSQTGPGNTTDNLGGTPAERAVGERAGAGTGAAGDRNRTDLNADANRDAAGRDRDMAARDAGAMGGADASVSQQLAQIRSAPENAGAKLFVLHAGMSNLHEIRLSELAARKSGDAKVKELAQMMVKEHTAANEQLRPIAQKMNVSLPSDLPGMKQQELAILEQLPADEFDKAYLTKLKVGHAMAITDFASHEQTIKDEQLKQYITRTLPKLRQHGQHVVQVAQGKGLSGDLVAIGGGSKPGTNLTGEGRE